METVAAFAVDPEPSSRGNQQPCEFVSNDTNTGLSLRKPCCNELISQRVLLSLRVLEFALFLVTFPVHHLKERGAQS
jgi:hypothetical protein